MVSKNFLDILSVCDKSIMVVDFVSFVWLFGVRSQVLYRFSRRRVGKLEISRREGGGGVRITNSSGVLAPLSHIPYAIQNAEAGGERLFSPGFFNDGCK